MQKIPLFVVYDTPYCVWEWDLKEKNLRCLDRMDSEYFRYVADSNYDQLTDEELRHRAAVAVRIGYHHGLETLFCSHLRSFASPPMCACMVASIYDIRTSQMRAEH